MIKLLRIIIQNIQRKKRTVQLVVLIIFLVTFLVIRTITHLQKLNLLPNQTSSLHIHHLVPGIFLLLGSGYLSLSYWSNEKLRHFMAVLFGIGAALTIDEFALWLFLKDVYWAKQGRDSVDAIIIITIIFTIGFVLSEVHEHKLHKIIQKELFSSSRK